MSFDISPQGLFRYRLQYKETLKKTPSQQIVFEFKQERIKKHELEMHDFALLLLFHGDFVQTIPHVKYAPVIHE